MFQRTFIASIFTPTFMLFTPSSQTPLFSEIQERLQVDISVRSTAQGLVDAIGRKHDIAYCRVSCLKFVVGSSHKF